MIIVLKPGCTVLGLIGDTSAIDVDYLAAQDFVESVKRVQEPYKKANRKFHPDDTVITLPGGQRIGDGAFKPRTSPYAFQGLKAGGNDQVILCERGIRTYETYTRNTLDLSAVPILKRLTHLPVIVDPSHASGLAWLVEPLAMAAVAAGADGMGELIKYGCIRSRPLFDSLGSPGGLTESLLFQCVDIKRQLVEADERDNGQRTLLNFGHTLGHALEKVHHYTGLTHGAAVGIGMVQMARLGEGFLYTLPREEFSCLCRRHLLPE